MGPKIRQFILLRLFTFLCFCFGRPHSVILTGSYVVVKTRLFSLTPKYPQNSSATSSCCVVKKESATSLSNKSVAKIFVSRLFTS